MANPGPIFLYFRIFNTVDSKQMFNINFADTWIRTTGLWYRKWPLYQLSYNHCHDCSELLKQVRAVFFRPIPKIWCHGWMEKLVETFFAKNLASFFPSS